MSRIATFIQRTDHRSARVLANDALGFGGAGPRFQCAGAFVQSGQHGVFPQPFQPGRTGSHEPGQGRRNVLLFADLGCVGRAGVGRRGRRLGRIGRRGRRRLVGGRVGNRLSGRFPSRVSGPGRVLGGGLFVVSPDFSDAAVRAGFVGDDIFVALTENGPMNWSMGRGEPFKASHVHAAAHA